MMSVGKLVSSVCHGAEIFKIAVDDKGVPIVKGKVRHQTFSDRWHTAGIALVDSLCGGSTVFFGFALHSWRALEGSKKRTFLEQ